MSVDSVRELFKKDKLENLILHSEVISDTVENAANLIGCEVKQIAKTMAFIVDDQPIVIVASGDVKIDNSKFKKCFKTKAKMVPFNKVEEITGHLPGGICPFALKENVRVFLDESLKRLDVVFTGGGDAYHTVKVTIAQLEEYSAFDKWVDVFKDPNA